MRKFIRGLMAVVSFLSLLMAGSAWSELIIRQPVQQQRFTINNNNINESSGLACSTRHNDLLWTHNDSGHMPIIYAMDNQGGNRGAFHLEGIVNIDWEDMDAFQYQGKHYLLIADTGDNLNMMLGHQISIIREPEPGRAGRSAVSPSWSFFFNYEDGHAHDVESVAVDVKREKIILLTKRSTPTLMFELPLIPGNEDKIQRAVRVASFPELINPSALDISADGQLMSVHTYGRIHRYSRKLPEQPWQYDYSLKYGQLYQPEAMCLSNTENHYYVSSEKQLSLLEITVERP